MRRTSTSPFSFGWSGVTVAVLVASVACGTSPPVPAGNGSPESGRLGGTTDPTLPQSTGKSTDFTKCATQTAIAQPKPVYLVFSVDESGSMSFSGKWDAAKAAARAFFESPDSVGVAASLGFFPFFPPGTPDDYSCTATDYTTPALPMTGLPSTSFGGILDGQSPNGATPTYVALSGAISYAQSVASGVGQGGTVALVLVTDGLPDSQCDGNSVEQVQGLAASAAGQGLVTYVIGVGPQLQRLHEIAIGGGTNKAFIVDTKAPDQIQHDLLAAMTSIRFQLACDYDIPPPPAGQQLDRGEVNVQYKVDGKTTTFLNSQDCADANGWRYDNPSDPKKILLCGSSCQTVRARPGEVDVLFGCATQYGAVK
jgi:hypothetical protein